ncbi:MAG: class I SAM-dependent methyltransferase [Prochloraceae cyanobacterium]|nr:class I SAM-dependent methyltransferase [Prochloraceae cyanobacterium]
MTEFYRQDLAYIHDIGFSDWAVQSAPGILEILAKNEVKDGLIVDLGCGTGLSAREFVKAGYEVLGIDISEGAIAIAKKKVPDAEFRLGSVFKVEIPACNAVIAISECLNYLFDRDNNDRELIKLFDRIDRALIPGGVFIFDIVEPGQVKTGQISQGFREGKDWIVLVEKEEDREKNILNRRIITFRKIGEYYRRDEEIHCQRLYQRKDIEQKLQEVGFKVEIMDGYGDYKLPIARVAFVATKSK